MKASRSLGKTLASLGALAGLSAAPALALADTDSYVEVQYDARIIADVLHRQIATMSDFCPQVTVLNGRSLFVDHLDLPNDGALSRADSADRIFINDFTALEGRAVLYTQPVDIHMKTTECALDPDCTATDPIAAELTYELYTTPASQLCIRSAGARGWPEGVQAPKVDVCLPFEADVALKVAGLPGQTASGNAVSLDRNGERLAVRVELGRLERDYDLDRLDAWQSFIDGTLEETGARGDWSVFAHKSLIAGAIQGRLSDALATQAGFNVDGPVEISWDPGETDARVDARFNGVFTSAICPGGIHVNDISVTGKVGQNDPDAPTGLLTTGSVSYHISSEDAAACGLSFGGPLGALIFSSLADSLKLDLSSLGPNCHPDGDFGFVCNEVTHPQMSSVGPLQMARSTLAGTFASRSGLAMNGSVAILGDGFPTSDAHATAFRYDDGAEVYASTLEVRGIARVCDATFRADQDGDIELFRFKRSSGALADWLVELPQAHVDAYERNPFHVMATVMTSAGVRTYKIDPDASLR